MKHCQGFDMLAMDGICHRQIRLCSVCNRCEYHCVYHKNSNESLYLKQSSVTDASEKR